MWFPLFPASALSSPNAQPAHFDPFFFRAVAKTRPKGRPETRVVAGLGFHDSGSSESCDFA